MDVNIIHYWTVMVIGSDCLRFECMNGFRKPVNVCAMFPVWKQGHNHSSSFMLSAKLNKLFQVKHLDNKLLLLLLGLCLLFDWGINVLYFKIELKQNFPIYYVISTMFWELKNCFICREYVEFYIPQACIFYPQWSSKEN